MPIVKANGKPANLRKGKNFKDGSRAAALEQARRMLAVAARLPEPITGDALQDAAGVKEVQPPRAALCRWERKKWVSRVGVGQYKRTKSFPKVRAGLANGTEVKNGNDVDPAGGGSGPLSDQLRQAKAELDLAVSRHEPTQARVLADKVADIEKRLTFSDE